MSSKRADWDQYEIGQCINLSLADMNRNEPLLVAASYFWANALNAFLFGHGPMTPTLADMVMLIGLNITSTATPNLLSKTSHRIETTKIGGWKKYISPYAKDGVVDHKEHSTFLMMWLEKFIFCGKSVGPSSKYHQLAEYLASGNSFPLGKYLLGSVYHLMHDVSV